MFITFICIFKITLVLVNQNFRRTQTIADFLLYLCLRYWVCLIGRLLSYSVSLCALFIVNYSLSNGQFQLLDLLPDIPGAYPQTSKYFQVIIQSSSSQGQHRTLAGAHRTK